MTIVFQMTNRVPNFIEQSHLETTEGMQNFYAKRTTVLTICSMDSVLVTNPKDPHASMS
jgi:hypothetical protein